MQSRFSHVQLFVTLWTTVCQAPLSMGFSRQEYWSGLPCPPSGDLPNPGIVFPVLEVGFIPLAPPGKSFGTICTFQKKLKSVLIYMGKESQKG